MTRRGLVLGFALLSATSTWRAKAHADPADATEFVRQAGRELSAIMDGPGTAEEKRARIPAFIDRVVDVAAVAQFCLGRYWLQASVAQRQEFVDLFGRVLTRQVTARVGGYTGPGAGQGSGQHGQVTMGRADAQADGIHVAMLLERPDGPPAHMVWLVAETPAGLRIVDLAVEGISLRLAERSDYVSFLQRNADDIDALLRALRKQVTS